MPNDIERLMVKLGMLVLDRLANDYTPDHADSIHAFLVVYGHRGQDWLTYHTKGENALRSQQ